MADTTPPTISITSNKTKLKAGESALVTFTLNKASTDFVLADISYSGGTISNFTGSGMSYFATFVPTVNSNAPGSVSVGNFKFSDAAGNANEDGQETNNRFSFVVDTISPTISISTTKTSLGFNESPTITFTLSEPSTDFDISDIFVTGGTLSSFKGSGSSYSVVFSSNSTQQGQVSIKFNSFSDSAGNLNIALSEKITLTPFDPLRPNLAWTSLIGTSGEDYAFGIASSIDGSIYIGGSTNGNLDGQLNRGLQDAFLTKYSKDGTKEWSRLLGTGGWDSIRSLATSLDGFIYVSGTTFGDLDGQPYRGGQEVFLTKFKFDGTKIWTRLVGNNGFNNYEASKLTLGLDGSIYVGGRFSGSDIAGGLTFSGDTFLTKYNLDGAKVWSIRLGTGGDYIDNALATGLDGSIYISGTGIQTLDGQLNRSSDVFLSKYSVEGINIWTRLISTGVSYGVTSLTIGLDGAIYVSGNTNRSLDEQANNGQSDIFITKYTAEGTKIWTRLLGSSGAEMATALTTGHDGAIYVSGYSLNSIDNQINNGNYDAVLVKFNPDGTKVWTKLIGSVFDDRPFGLTSSLGGDLYVSGYTFGDLDGQVNNGSADAFVSKLILPNTALPTIIVSSNKSSLFGGETAVLNFNLSKPSTNFIQSDIVVQGGTLSDFKGSGTSYTANFTAFIDASSVAYVSVGSGKFSDALGVFNEDGADATNTVAMTINTVPPINTVLGTNLDNFITSTSSIDHIDGGAGMDTVIWP